jgi:hypothetical protein
MDLSMLSKVSEVDNLLNFANDRKDDLDFRRIVLNREKKEMTGTVTDIGAELNKVNAKITASNAILGVLTDTDEIKDETLRKERLELRKKGLENRQDDVNVEALAKLEYELEELQVRIAKADEWIDSPGNRKTQLEAAGPPTT